MSVSRSSSVVFTPATTTNANGTINVTGTNPLILIDAGISHATATITSASWSLGSGSAVQVTSVRSGTAYASIWAIPAPASGTGTANLGFSASVPVQVVYNLYVGADQTTPCPSSDSITFVSTGAGSSISHTSTPSNLVAGDASNAVGASDTAGNPTSSGPTQIYLNNGTAINLEAGDATGTTGVFCNWDGTLPQNIAMVTVRIQQPIPGGPPLILSNPTDQTVDYSNLATFTVSASSQTGSTLSYQWQENNVDIASATNASVSINTGATDQNAVFDVSVWDANGTTNWGNAVLRLNINGTGYYLQEDGTSKYQLENASGFYILESWSTSGATSSVLVPFWWGDLDGLGRRFRSDRLN